jgi:hypothetical protein
MPPSSRSGKENPQDEREADAKIAEPTPDADPHTPRIAQHKPFMDPIKYRSFVVAISDLNPIGAEPELGAIRSTSVAILSSIQRRPVLTCRSPRPSTIFREGARGWDPSAGRGNRPGSADRRYSLGHEHPWLVPQFTHL